MAIQFVTVSVDILRDNNLTANEKFILAEIEQLSQLDNGCHASNQHFANLLNISKQSASRTINSLESKGYIGTEIKIGTRNRVRIIKMFTRINKSDNTYQQNVETVSTKCLESKENIQTNIQLNINVYDDFISTLKKKVKTPSKVTSTKQGRELFKNIPNKQQLISDYIMHQNTKGEYAQRITAFMEDYKTTQDQPSKPRLMIGGCEI